MFGIPKWLVALWGGMSFALTILSLPSVPEDVAGWGSVVAWLDGDTASWLLPVIGWVGLAALVVALLVSPRRSPVGLASIEFGPMQVELERPDPQLRVDVIAAFSSVIGAFDYHEPHLKEGRTAPNPDYVGTWPETYRMLERQHDLQAEKREVERGFQALARYREGFGTAQEARYAIRKARRAAQQALEKLGAA